MCILFIYVDPRPVSGGYKLILASNRDEFFVRPAADLSQWKNATNAFGGLDMEPGREGGTWLAISGNNGVVKVGALLNITGEIKRSEALGRGPIVVNYVTGDEDNQNYSRGLIQDPHLYSAFNFVSVEIGGDQSKILHCSNAPPSVQAWAECEPHGFGNSPPDTPYIKVQEGTKLFGDIVESYKNNKEFLVDNCMHLLKNPNKFWPDKELKRRAPNWGENLSAICVRDLKVGYGSRTNSVILVDSKNKMDFYENTMKTRDPEGEWKFTHLQKQLF